MHCQNCCRLHEGEVCQGRGDQEKGVIPSLKPGKAGKVLHLPGNFFLEPGNAVVFSNPGTGDLSKHASCFDPHGVESCRACENP